MNEYLMALAFAALPAFGNFAGGLIAEVFRVSPRLISLALHAAAGIVFAVVGVELMPQALQAHAPWVPILAFVAGGGFFALMDRLIAVAQNRFGGGRGGTAAWAIYFGVAVDLFSDGIMIGTGSTIRPGLGLLLALGQTPADVPEGFATIANLKARGLSRGTRLLLSGAFALPILLGTTVGFWAVRDQPEIVKLALLAFTAGILSTVVVEEMVTEAHGAQEDTPWMALAFVGGFALFALISTYLG